MAKGNLFLGMAHGSIGDTTFYRQNGQQISRVRNRVVANPQTEAQQLQRAIAATVGQAYKAGKAIFDHSFEGKRVPSGSANEFRSVNMRQLREDYKQDLINGGATGALDVACFSAPKSNRPVPYTFTVSRGSLVQSLFSVIDDGQNENKVCVQVATGTGTVAEWAAANNLVAGDIYTIVGFGSFGAASIIEDYANAPETRFGFIRLTVKDGLSSVTTAFNVATLADVFDIDTASTPIPGSTLLSAPINIDQVVSSCLTGAIGVIRSQENSGLRSNCRLMVRGASTANNMSPWVGIKSVFVLDAWNPDASRLGDSSLILEGGNF